MHASLWKEGYVLSRQVLYLYLIPGTAASQDGRRNATRVPVKLRKAKNILLNGHVNADFAFAMKRQTSDIVSLFGSDNIFVLSVVDKAKAPIAVTAVAKQAPLIMHVSYKIGLPDHDFVKATK